MNAESCILSGHKQLQEDIHAAESITGVSGGPEKPSVDAAPVDPPQEPSSSSGINAKDKDQQGLGQKDGAQTEKGQKEDKDHEDKSLDLTQQYGTDLEIKDTQGAEATTTKDRFLNCELVVPGIALKKLKQVETTDYPVNTYVGILGKSESRMYKVTKPHVCTMMMADFCSDTGKFWEHAERQCKNHSIGAICMFDSFEKDWSEALV